jgi:UDP-N-acetylglucosamine transferase subunit ALG13
MKIFLTVGSMLPFDRLVQAMDMWAKERPDVQIFAQIGETSLRPVNIDFSAMISPSEYRNCFIDCDVVVSHVGMGTVITAFELGKPLVMLPRRPDFQEVTSNHQIATAQWLEGRPGVRIAHSVDELDKAISESIGSVGVSKIETGTSKQLIGAIRQFISN